MPRRASTGTAIIALVLHAQAQVATGADRSLGFYKLVAFLGFLTVAIHSGFFVAGYAAFIQPMSIALLAATAVLSALQLAAIHRQVHT